MKGSVHTRLAALYSEIAALHEKLAEGSPGEDYVDQRRSPLGARLHCRLVRQGVLHGSRVGKRTLVRRADIDAYLERQQIIEKKTEQPGVRRVLTVFAEHGGKVA